MSTTTLISTTTHAVAAAKPLVLKAASRDGQLELIRAEEDAWRRGEYKACVQICTALIQGSREAKANFFVLRARALLELHRHAEAAADTELAARLQPTNARAFALMAYAQVGLLEAGGKSSTAAAAAAAAAAALAALARAKDLDPALEDHDAFQKCSQACDRIVSCAAAAPSAFHHPAPPMDRHAPRPERCGEDALAARASQAGAVVLSRSDAAQLKAELLSFLASLHRRVLHLYLHSGRPLVDLVQNVRSLCGEDGRR